MTAIRTVDLVDRNDRTQANFQRLANNELRLWHWTFSSVNENDSAVNHRKNTLNFAAEVGVARRVDDVDTRVFPDNRSGLRENGDPAFLFDVVGIHHAFCNALVVAERAGLLQEFIDQSGFAMIDVCDNSDITQFHMEITSI